MTFQRGQFAVRLPRLALQYLGNRRTVLSSSRVERVPALYNVFQSQHYSNLVLQYRSNTPNFSRTYAQSAKSRPKAHTGRTTTAARKAPTTSKTKAAKKPAPQKKTPKAVPKAKSKAKPRIKAKPKPAKKKKAKAKAKPKRKVKKPKLTEAQKAAALKKKLTATALKPPHGLAYTAWQVFAVQKMKATEGGISSKNIGPVMKNASAEYKQLTPEQVENYNHLANQNKIANATAYREWIESHSPTIIHEANLARRHLQRLGAKAKPLQDQRQVRRIRTSYTLFSQSRMKTGDFRGLKIPEAAKLIAREWKGLEASEKKPFEDLAAQDMTRYIQERKTVLNLDVKSSKRKA